MQRTPATPVQPTRGAESEGALAPGWLIGAAGLFVFDAFIVNQGVLAIFTAFVATVALVGSVFLGRSRRIVIWKRSLLFLVVALAVLGTNELENQMARDRADEIIAACRRFRDDTGAYPDELADLVPTYLPDVPRAKPFVLGDFGAFRYLSFDGRHSLQYTSFPPFGRPYYRLEDERWGYLD